MTGNEITGQEQELWAKVFRLNNAIKANIKKYHSLREECESEINVMNSPSKETVDKIRSTELSLATFTQALSIYQKKLVRLNPNFHLN